MRYLKILALFVCLLALVSIGIAGENFGIRDVSRVTFVAPVRVGTTLLPAGDYVVRHTMEGAEHVMVFQPASGKGQEAKVKCHLVALGHKAVRDETTYQLNAANERVLQELVFRGDTAKHVF